MKNKKLDILIVDDNAVFINSFKNLLMEVNGKNICSIDYTNTGAEGLYKLCSSEYDFVFLDIEMPDISGISIAKIICDSNFTPRTKVYAVSFHSEYEFKYKMEKAGVTKYLRKDEINFESLLEIFNQG